MSESLSTRLRGLVFLCTALFTAGLFVYLLLNPGTLIEIHPIPLLVLLLLTTAVAFWQARELFRS